MVSKSTTPQHKRMAMGEPVGFAKGGMVKAARNVMPATPVGQIKGTPMSPLTKAKMQNGIPGYKKGGTAKDCKC